MKICEECGLLMVECSAIAIGRHHAELFLRDKGYTSLAARDASRRLIPIPQQFQK